MQIRVSPTDAEWFRFLRARPDLDEANFWIPSGATSRTQPGERILFKSKAAAGNRLIGGACISGFNRMRVSEAWALFGEGNGVASREHLLAKINRWRTENKHPPEADPVIGCLLLHSTFFVADDSALPPPPSFRSEAVRGRGYAPDHPSYSDVDTRFVDLFWRSGLAVTRPDDDLVAQIVGPTRGEARAAVPRVGQQAFKGLLLTSYGRRCAITGSRIEPVLEAAHIRPVAHDGQHRLDNGLLLRADVHRMFDAGYLGVDEKHRLQVSRRLRDDFGNGTEFYSREGQQLEVLPSRRVDKPASEFLTWHMDTVFKSP